MSNQKASGKFSLDSAKATADTIIARLAPYCSRIEIAGSIRRRRPRVNDIDLVLIPSDLWNLHYEILALCRPYPVTASWSKIMRFDMPSPSGPMQVDIYFATQETWATLLLIRTGSAENNIRLCARAKSMGMKLHADGRGLFQITTCDVGTPREDRIAGDTEASIFAALGLPYQEPSERG